MIMDWQNIDLTTRIKYLIMLLENSNDAVGYKSHQSTVNSLLTGSQNKYAGDMSFEFTQSHYKYLYNLWNSAMKNQKDNSVVDLIKSEVMNNEVNIDSSN